MSAEHTPTPETSLDFVIEWFSKCAASAERLGKRDSAQLWRDGLQHIEHLAKQREELLTALQAIVSDGDYTSPEGMKRMANAAIAKITGGAQ